MNTNRDETLLKAFGQNLKKLRTERKLSIRVLAFAADVDFSTVRRIEAGSSNPTYTTILALAKALKVDPCLLINFES